MAKKLAVSELSAKFDQIVLDKNKQIRIEHAYSSCSSSTSEHVYASQPLQATEENEDELVDDEVFAIPRIDELSSSSEDSDFELEFDLRNDRILAIGSMANAIQAEFLQKLPKARPDLKSRKRLLAGSVFKSFPMESFTQTKASSSRCVQTDDKLVNPPLQENVYESIETGVYSTAPASSDYTSLVPPELPKNALVLLYGCIKMRADELRDLNLKRCLSTLLQGTETKFALLRIQDTSFTLENCDNHKEESNENLTQEKTKKRKKKSPNFRRNSSDESAHILTRNSLNTHKGKHKKTTNFLSCMSCAYPSEYQLLQHNDSICLKAYEGIRKRKRILEFEYKRVIFCGAEIEGMPGNILTWVYHVVKGNYGAVECYAVECDDISHARLLSKALGQQILSFAGS